MSVPVSGMANLVPENNVSCKPLPLLTVIGGRTGSGKTKVLKALSDRGEQVIDLEGLAQHKGSAFGRVGIIEPQPSNAQYENLLAIAWLRADASKRVWIEHEDVHVGTCRTPVAVFDHIMTAPGGFVCLDVPLHARVKSLVNDYCNEKAQSTPGWRASLRESIIKLKKRVNHDIIRSALDSLEKDEFSFVASAFLTYYDKLYDRHAAGVLGNALGIVSCDAVDPQRNADLVQNAVREAELQIHTHNSLTFTFHNICDSCISYVPRTMAIIISIFIIALLIPRFQK